MLPVVAIVGRPNVGKSTLFNRLTRTRNALISAYPGTTRDRQYGEVVADDKHFIIIDTGGLTEETDVIGDHIAKQAELAIQEADKIIFLIDGKAGVTSEDAAIAQQLRRLGKPIFLTVNKTESADPNTVLNDAYELGMGEPVAIAAVHGRGIDALINALFPEPTIDALSPEEKSLQGIKVAFVGCPNAGKSTLTNRMLGEERVIVSDLPGTTRDSIYIPLERHGQRYTLIDTAGVRKRKSMNELPEKFSVVKTLQSIEDANVVVYVIDARVGLSQQDMKLLGFIVECGRALVITINKWDGMSDADREHVRLSIDRQLDFVRFARLNFISALHGSGVGLIFDAINEAFECATRKLSTHKLTELLQQAIVTHSPPLVHGRRVKLRYAHSGGNNPPRIIIHGNQVNDLPDSYRRYLAGFYQEKLKLYGTPVLVSFKLSNNPYAKHR